MFTIMIKQMMAYMYDDDEDVYEDEDDDSNDDDDDENTTVKTTKTINVESFKMVMPITADYKW